MQLLVTLHNQTSSTPGFPQVVVDVPDDYSFESDVDLVSHSASMKQFMALCYEQVPSGFHKAHWCLKPENRDTTTVIAISRLK